MRRVDPARYEEKRQEILAAAKQCFSRYGFNSASISDICRAAKISPGHLYHYFENKEAIVEAIVQAALKEGAESFGKLVEESNLVGALGVVIDQAKGHHFRKDFPLLLEGILAAGRNPKLAKILKEHTRRMRLTLADMLKQGQSAGIVAPGLDPEMAAGLLFAVLDGTRLMLTRDPSVDLVKLREHLKILVSRFLLAVQTHAPGAG